MWILFLGIADVSDILTLHISKVKGLRNVGNTAFINTVSSPRHRIHIKAVYRFCKDNKC